MQNSVKDNIKSALEAAGFSTCVQNVELLYSIYMNGPGGGNFGSLVKAHKTYLRKGR